MALADVPPEGAERAMVESDRLGREAFLARFGFGKPRGQFLIRGGRRYDSKPVIGAAHGYDRPDLGPLRPHDFAGGDATVARHLESLGFDVARPPHNPTWAEEELILALDLYLRSGLLDDTNQAVVEISRVLHDLEVRADRPDVDRFRYPNGVAMKLANSAAVDPNYHGRGLTRMGRRDADVWDRYASDEEALAAIAAAIRERQGVLAVQPAEQTRAQIVEVEAQHVEQFQVSVPSQEIEATRREQSLVLSYIDHLEGLGHRVTRHRYPLYGTGPALVCDLVDETDLVLYEAKGDVRRSSVRMAIGQLLDYRRFEPASMSLAILLPRQPAKDIIRLIGSVHTSTVWRTKEGFENIQPSATSIKESVNTEVPR